MCRYDEATEVAQVKALIEATIPKFIEKHAVFISDTESANLHTALRNKEPLSHIRHLVHQCLCRNLSSTKGFDSTPFWSLEDGLNFLEDVITSRWQYLNEEGRRRYLNWSRECVLASISDNQPAQS